MASVSTFEEAFPALFAVAYRVAYRTLGSAADAEEVAQETLTRALMRWSSVEDYAAPWVATVSLRLAIDNGRRRRRAGRAPVDAEATAPAEDWERRLDLQAALQRLPKRQRQVLACRYLADLPDDETARLLDITPGSVKQHAARGLAALRLTNATTEGPAHA